MELNREKIEKSLDWLDSLVGYSNDDDIAIITYQLLGILYDTCEELTEENEKLTQKLKIANLEIECKERICESYMLQYGTVADKEVWLKKERADTVRKMQSELKKTFSALCKGEMNDLYRIIDQIAKEMIENG